MLPVRRLLAFGRNFQLYNCREADVTTLFVLFSDWSKGYEPEFLDLLFYFTRHPITKIRIAQWISTGNNNPYLFYLHACFKCSEQFPNKQLDYELEIFIA